MNIFEQEITYALEKIADKTANGDVAAIEDIISVAQLVDARTALLVQLREQIMMAEMTIQKLTSELETAGHDMEDMYDIIEARNSH